MKTIAHRGGILVAASPGRMRDSLCLLLGCVVGLAALDLADDSGAAARAVTERRPALVLLDTNLPGGPSGVLARVRSNGSRSRCLVLADSVRQVRAARRAGADAALLKGFSAAELYEQVGTLLAGWQEEQDGAST